VAIIIFGKSIAAFVIVKAFGHSTRNALTIAASLAQIGEFSFILVALGTDLGMLPEAGRDLVLAGAIISIFLNPFLFSFIMAMRAEKEESTESEAAPQHGPAGHIVLAGYGRVGRLIAQDLKSAGSSFIVIEDQADIAKRAEADGFKVLKNNALDPRTLETAGIARASQLLLAIPEGFEAGAIFQHARAQNPTLRVIARAHSDAEVEHLQKLGVAEIVLGEQEIATRIFELCRRPAPAAAKS